jgi:hypothetical protein
MAFLESILKEHIVKSHDEFGVFLWGTVENRNSLQSASGIVEWLPLSRPTCARIIQLGKLAASGMVCGESKEHSRTLSGDDALQFHSHYTAVDAALPGECQRSATNYLTRAFPQIARSALQVQLRATSTCMMLYGARVKGSIRAACVMAAKRLLSLRATRAPAAL